MNQNKTTPQQVDEVLKELGDALKEAIAIDEEKVKLAERDRLNRTRLLNAKTAVRELRIEY